MRKHFNDDKRKSVEAKRKEKYGSRRIYLRYAYDMNGHDDIVYLNKPSRRQSNICHLTRSVVCTLPARELLGSLAASWPGDVDDFT